jgi:hypothetical protein
MHIFSLLHPLDTRTRKEGEIGGTHSYTRCQHVNANLPVGLRCDGASFSGEA